MTKKQWEFRYLSISLLLGIGFGLAAGTISYFIGDTPSPKIDFMCGLLATMIASILTMQVLHSRTLSDVEHTAREALKVGQNALKIGSVNATLTQKLHELAKLSPLVQATLAKALNESIKEFKLEFENHRIYIPAGQHSWQGYHDFWTYIRELQGVTDGRIVIRVTHSSEPEVFYSRYARENINPIQEVISKTGSIFMLFVDLKPREPERIKRYLRIINDLPKSIICAYINVSSYQYMIDAHSECEFCIEDKTGYSAEWILKSPSEVDGFILTMDEKRLDRNLAKWNSLLDLLKRYDYHANDVERALGDRLVALKDTFLQRYYNKRSWRIPLPRRS